MGWWGVVESLLLQSRVARCLVGFLGAGVLLGLVCSLVEPEKQKKDGVA